MDSAHFYIALFVHLVSLIIGFGSVLVIDTFGLLMLMGKQPLSQVKKVASVTQVLIWAGWLGMVISGLNLIILKGYVDNLTKIKLFFVLIVGLNGVFLHFIKKAIDKIEEKKDIPKIWMFRMGMATAISQTGWWGALLIGFVHRHIEHNIVWPQNPYVWIMVIIAVFGLGVIIGESTVKNS